MKISINVTKCFIWVLTVFTLVTYIIFETYAWGRYAYLASSMLIFILSTFTGKGRFWIGFAPFYGFMLLFALFCLLSAIWAAAPSDALQNAETVMLILLCAIPIYIHYKQEENIQKLLDAVRWSGFLVAVYTIAFYGLDMLILATSGARVTNTFSNVNTIAMASAIACIIQVHEALYRKHRWESVWMIPCVVVIAASQSRKALLLLLIGLMAIYLVKDRKNRNVLEWFVKIILIFLAAVVAIVVLYHLPIFAGLRLRMDSMFAGFLGQEGADQSTINRTLMQELGWKLFLQYPIGGVGMGNAHVYAARELWLDTYLHNNYAELLSSGGILGFAIYYGMYAYLLRNLMKYRKADRKYFEIGLVWLILMLIMDYGMVSYYSKAQWFYLMIHFLNVVKLREKGRRQVYAN